MNSLIQSISFRDVIDALISVHRVMKKELQPKHMRMRCVRIQKIAYKAYGHRKRELIEAWRKNATYGTVGTVAIAAILVAEILFPSSMASALATAQEAKVTHQDAILATPKVGPRLEYAGIDYTPAVSLPDNGTSLASDAVPVREMWVASTAYSSDPWQTDATPYSTAIGTHVRDGVVAANFLPFGTKIRIPDYYGDQVFLVEDRMNARYYYKVDIWMEDRADAFQWGYRNVRIQIF